MSSRASELYGLPWREKEFLLALDLYVRLREQPRHLEVPEVQELATLIGRTPAAILMRLENYASIDPVVRQSRRGLAHIPEMGHQIFESWFSRPEQLSELASVLRREARHGWPEQKSLFDLDPVYIPKAFDSYELLDCIGRGGFGSVFTCVHIESGDARALKIIHPNRVHADDTIHRFKREIRALKHIDHPNVITIFEDNLDKEEDFPGFIMELATSNLTDLANALYSESQDRPVLSSGEALDILQATLRALRALHSGRPAVIHRDVNPNNILRMPDGRWVLADFGLAKFLGAAAFTTSFQTRTERGPGTGYYTAPEQYRDLKRTDERVDIYSMGILLWELFTSAFPMPNHQSSGLPTDLEGIFVKATQQDPRNRYQSVAEFEEALNQVTFQIENP